MTQVTIQEAVSDLMLNYKLRIPTLLMGQAGIGKSDAVREAARNLGIGLIDIRLSQRDAVDTRGLPVADMEARTTVWLTPSDLPNAERDGQRGILFLDEITNAPFSVQAAGYQLVLDRRLGDYVLPDGWQVIAAGNRASDKSAAGRLAAALGNRFAFYTIKPDVNVWLSWAKATGLAAELQAFVRFRPELLFGEQTGDAAFASPRSVARVSPYLNEALPNAQLRRCVSANAGEQFASEFMSFLPMFRSLPSPSEILANADTINIPQEPSLRYAIAVALANVIDDSTIAAGRLYASRMGAEYAELMLTDALARDPSLAETRAYIDHATSKARVQ